MRIRGPGFASLLTRAERDGKLPAVCAISSDEPLLALEAEDAIRALARRLGFSEREVIHADARMDWSQLAGAAQGLSLFAERRLIELRLPTGKPGVTGAAALEAHAAAAHADLLTLVSLPKLEWRVLRDARWLAALDEAGVFVEIDRIGREELPAWIGARLRRQGQSADDEALEFISERVEGNLLAAHQEIVKLGLLHPAGTLSLEQVREAVLDVARYDVFQLPALMLAGESARLLRSATGLRAEGAPIPLVVWAIGEDLRTLLRLTAQTETGRSPEQAVREARVRRDREGLFTRALPRVTSGQLQTALRRLGQIDRTAKGLRAGRADSDAWLELSDVALSVAQGSPA